MSDEKQYDREMGDGGRPPQELVGFYRVGKSWAHWCPRCGVLTTGAARLRNGLVMRAFCCGRWKEKTFTYRDWLAMPKDKSNRSFPVLTVGPRGEGPAPVVYEKSDIRFI